GLQAELGHGERVEAQEVVATLQGLPSVSIEVEPRAAGDEDLLPLGTAVEHALEKASPAAVLVELVEDEPACDRKLAPQDALAIAGHVPVEVADTRARQDARPLRLHTRHRRRRARGAGGTFGLREVHGAPLDRRSRGTQRRVSLWRCAG